MSPRARATAADLAATYGEDSRVEIIHGEMLPKAMSRVEHVLTTNNLTSAIWRRFHRATTGRWPGGWWILPELHVEYETHELFCHDCCGYRRDVHPPIPKSWPVRIRPDWVLESISPGHEKRDIVDKWRVLETAGVPHYWIMYPEDRTLLVHRWEAGGYRRVLTAGTGETIRAEPFDAVELRTDVLFDTADDDD